MSLAPNRSAPARRRGRPVATYVESQRPVVLDAAGRHLVKRFSSGLTPALATQVKRAGGARAWFEKQLRPGRIADPPGDAVDAWFPASAQTPKQIFNRRTRTATGRLGGHDRPQPLDRRPPDPQQPPAPGGRWSTSGRTCSTCRSWTTRPGPPADRLRPRDPDARARRRSRTCSRRTTIHPAMGLFLDNAVSTKDAPNENLGRELLELHTVGVDGGYTEDDVKASSRMLTGYRVDLWWPEFRSFYDEAGTTPAGQGHGLQHANAAATAGPATKAYLPYLAQHPATAQRLARRLCVRFVSDTAVAGDRRRRWPRRTARTAPPSSRRCGRWSTTRTSPRRRRRQDPHADRGLRRHGAGARHQAADADAGRLVRERHVLAVQRARPRAVRVAGAQRLPRGRRRVDQRRPDAQRLRAAPRPRRRLVADQGGDVPRRWRAGCRRCRRPSATSSTTSARELLGAEAARRGTRRRRASVAGAAADAERHRATTCWDYRRCAASSRPCSTPRPTCTDERRRMTHADHATRDPRLRVPRLLAAAQPPPVPRGRGRRRRCA